MGHCNIVCHLVAFQGAHDCMSLICVSIKIQVGAYLRLSLHALVMEAESLRAPGWSGIQDDVALVEGREDKLAFVAVQAVCDILPFCRACRDVSATQGRARRVRGMAASRQLPVERHPPACQCTCPRVGQPTHRLVSWGDQVGSSAQGSGVTNVKLSALGCSKHSGNTDMGVDVASR